MTPHAQSLIFALAGTKRKWFSAYVKAEQGWRTQRLSQGSVFWPSAPTQCN